MYELQGAWDRALAARAAAAEAFAEQGQELEAATEQLAAASHLQSAANLTSTLDLIAGAGPAVERTGSIQLRVHALSLEGQIRAKLGDTHRGVALAREGLALALAENLTEPAAEAYYRLASALQAAADYSQALDAYAAASDFCDQQGIAGMGEVCFACLAPVMVKTGEWDRAVEVCRAILDVGDAPATARMVAAAELGIVYVLRGETRRTRRLLSDSLGFSRRNELFGLGSRPPTGSLAPTPWEVASTMRCNVHATSSVASPTGRSVTIRCRRFAGPRPCSRARASRLTSPARRSCSPRPRQRSAPPRRWPGSGTP
jgi:tetratricopeptide (TPR) repeat protein